MLEAVIQVFEGPPVLCCFMDGWCKRFLEKSALSAGNIYDDGLMEITMDHHAGVELGRHSRAQNH
jgi:hypothetical protein